MRKTARSIALILAVVMIIAMFPMTVSAASYKPGKVKITTFKVSSVSKSTNTATVKIKWKKVSKATGYWVYQKVDGKWKCIRKLGKNYVGITIKKVFAGSNAFRVCAVRKVGKKYYKGAFATKSKFITSPLTYETVLKIVGEDTSFIEEMDDAGSYYQFVVTGNKVAEYYVISGDDANRPDTASVSTFFSDIKSSQVKLCKTARVYAGVKGVKVTVYLYFNGEPLGSRTYSE